MTLGEFELIERYFKPREPLRPDVVLGIGDDAALLRPPVGMDLALTTDTLVAGVHFDDRMDAADIGHRALAVNLSDLAAMGATPAWTLLALTMPEADEAWIQAFADGFMSLATRHCTSLVGGNLARGPRNVTVTVAGLLPMGQALRRSGARPGDDIYVTGTLGDARLALAIMGGLAPRATVAQRSDLYTRYARPEPRLSVGQRLLGIASSAIDISDGLASDLGHLLDGNRIGAVVEAGSLPLSRTMREVVTDQEARDHALFGSDDYELCFTARPALAGAIRALAADCTITRIGTITDGSGINLRYPDGSEAALPVSGYRHF
jgi:thiamine-monophosphate kinase